MACALAALIAAATVMMLSFTIALRLMPLFESHYRWLVPACALFTAFSLGAKAWKTRHATRDDGSLTPLMRAPLTRAPLERTPLK